MNARGIQTGVSWIIGYPNESAEAMHETITVAARIKHKFHNSPSDVFPFRAIPGSEDFNTAVELGYEPPHSLKDWGSCLEYKYVLRDAGLPEDVVRRWRRYGATSTFYDGLAKEGAGVVRSLMRMISGWRLRTNNFAFPLEQRLFHAFVQLSGKKTQGDIVNASRSSDATPSASI